jgi:hypothetical protein
MGRVEGKVALVTGAANGIGAACARMLAAEGARVAVTDIEDDAGRAVAAAIGGAAYLRLDVREVDDWRAAMDAVLARFGRLDVLVNNAGITGFEAGYAPHDPEHASLDDWRAVHRTNLDGVWRVATRAAQGLVAAGRPGTLINIASVLGLRQGNNLVAYNTAKAGVVQLTKTLALEWARHGIRVNAIAPGYVETEINQGFFATEAGQNMVKRVPQRRIGLASDLDGALLLLASEAGRYMTGATIDVNGGIQIR